MSVREKTRQRTQKVWEGARYAGIGLELGLSVAIGYFVGTWLDEQYGFAPWGGLVGVILGFSSGLRSLFKIAMRESKNGSVTPSVTPIIEKCIEGQEDDQDERTQ